MKILNNQVLIKPDKDYTELKTGLKIVDAANTHLHASVIGTVLVVPDKLLYLGYEIPKLNRHNQRDVQRIRDINDFTMPHDTDLEIKVGDRVVFNWAFQMDKPDLFKGNILIPYSELFCRINDGEIYPLNGRIIVEQVKQDIIFGGVKVGEKRSDTEGVVRYAGCLNRDYLTLPMQAKQSDDPQIQVGSHIFFERNGLTRVEYQLYKELTDFELWTGFRKDILGIFAT